MILELLESISKKVPLLVIDVQPTSKEYIRFDMYEFVQMLNTHKGEINYFYNGESLGMDNEYAVTDWLRDFGLENEDINFMEKEYAWIRDPMDQGYDEDDIVKILEYMLKKKKYDVRDLSEKELRALDLDDNFVEDLLQEDVFMGMPSVLDELKDLPNKGVIIGGGENECLYEIEITLSALGKKYKRENKFIY